MDWLLFVIGKLLAKWIDTEGGWRCDGYSVLCGHEETLANGRDRRGGDALREAFVVDVGDVIDAKAAGPGSCVGVFAAGLHIEDIAFVAIVSGNLAAVRDELLVVVRIGDALEIAAINGLGLVMLSDGDGFEILYRRSRRKCSAP